jgi:hypothetical protein
MKKITNPVKTGIPPAAPEGFLGAAGGKKM